MTLFVAFIVATLLVVALFESGVLTMGGLISDNKQTEFGLTIMAEIMALALIPLALRLFKISVVCRRLVTMKAVLRWELVRVLMLCIPLLLDTLLYYLYLNVSFGYLSIILFLCLFFIVPTERRCRDDLMTTENEQ